MKIEELHRAFFNYRFSFAIMIAIKIGLFDLLDDQKLTVSNIADKLGLCRERIEVLIDFLIIHDIISNVGDEVYLKKEFISVLTSDSQNSMVDLMLLDSLNVHKWLDLNSVFDTDFLNDQKICRDVVFRKAMSQRVTQMNEKLVELITRYKPKSVVDIGCGPGSVVNLLLNKSEIDLFYLVDLPDIISVTKREFQSNFKSEEIHNVHYIGGDVLNNNLAIRTDFVLISRLLMGFNEKEVRRILVNVCSIIEKSGLLMINEFNINTKIGISMSLDMVVNCGSSILSLSKYCEILSSFHMNFESLYPTSKYTYAMCFRKE